MWAGFGVVLALSTQWPGVSTDYSPTLDAQPDPNTRKVWHDVLAVFDDPRVAELSLFANPGVAAVADFCNQGRLSKVVYSPGFITRIHRQLGWGGAHGVFARAVARRLLAVHGEPEWLAVEGAVARAETLTGCALARLDLHPKVLRRSLRVLSEQPLDGMGWASRRDLIKSGFERCGGRELPPIEGLPARVQRCAVAGGWCQLSRALEVGARCACSVGGAVRPGVMVRLPIRSKSGSR